MTWSWPEGLKMLTTYIRFTKIDTIHIPIGSMYAIYANIYHQYTPNVTIYSIHGSYGWWSEQCWLSTPKSDLVTVISKNVSHIPRISSYLFNTCEFELKCMRSTPIWFHIMNMKLASRICSIYQPKMREPCFQDRKSDVSHIISRFQTVMARNMSYKSVSHPIYGMTPIYFTIEITSKVPFTPFFSRFPRCFFSPTYPLCDVQVALRGSSSWRANADLVP